LNHGDSLGSGFTIELNDKQYLISAKHIFDSFIDGDKVEINIFQENDYLLYDENSGIIICQMINDAIDFLKIVCARS